MKLNETIECADGTTVTLAMAKLKAEDTVNGLLDGLQQSMLQAVPNLFDQVWLKTPTPDSPVETDEQFYAAVKASIHLAMVMGIADAMRVTLNKIHTSLTT